MTACLVAMNSGAVAVAADSALEVSYGRNLKHYQGATKVVSLHRDRPVAALWYGSPDYLGVPWETIIKDFRSKHPEPRATIDDYAAAFMDHLDREVPTWAPTSAELDPPARVVVENLLVAVTAALQRKRSIDPSTIIDVEIDKWQASRGKAKRVLDPEKLDSLGEMTWLQRRLDRLDADVDGLSGSNREKLVSTVRRAWSRFAASEEGHTGLVFTGFGEHERLPAMRPYLVGAPVGSHARRFEGKGRAVTGENPALVAPFAQTDQVAAFMEGITPALKDCIQREVKELGLDEGVRDRLSRRLDDHVFDHQKPVLDAVRFLPKGDLAEFARFLIALTAFRLRMSLSAETVGEPIEVAVLSRAEGMVWIHRVHYFTAELNPHYGRGIG